MAGLMNQFGMKSSRNSRLKIRPWRYERFSPSVTLRVGGGADKRTEAGTFLGSAGNPYVQCSSSPEHPALLISRTTIARVGRTACASRFIQMVRVVNGHRQGRATLAHAQRQV